MEFQLAVRRPTNAKMLLEGPPGSGKTLTALKLMRGLVGPNGKIIMIETERLGEGIARSSPYEKMGHFIGLMTPPFRPQKFIDAINAAINAGADGIIIDSLTDEWDGIGGYTDWRNEISDTYGKTTKPVHRELMQLIELCPVHFIGTMRAEPRAVFEQKPDGTNGKITRMAEQVVGAKDAGYRVMLEMSMRDGEFMTVVNSRYDEELPNGITFPVKDDTFLETLKVALNMGESLPMSKSTFAIELARLGIKGNAAMVALQDALPDLGKWSPERHQEMVDMVRAHVLKTA